ncbi:hypothetical protein C8T65DRAFT_703030 [Cerioporus squamosus]|nr:hypothetical protein C8T65DRAFT_703030 [Cerioporus squamosus]
MDSVDRAQRAPDDVVVEHFRTFYNCENDGKKKHEYLLIYVAFVQEGTASAQSNGAALIVTDCASGDVLFDGVIGKGWEFFYFPSTLQPGAPPECQVVTNDKDLVKDGSEDPELLQWFSFLSEADQLRFRDLFEAALQAARLNHEDLQTKLVTAIIEKGLHVPARGARQARTDAAGAENATSE